MQLTNFKDGKSGRLVKGNMGYWAFVPNPLEPELQLDMPLVKALSGATLGPIEHQQAC